MEKNNYYSIYFNCVSFSWGLDDDLYHIMDSKIHKNFMKSEKITISDKSELDNFKKNYLKANHGNQKIDSVFKNETEDLIHEMSMNEIVNSSKNMNCMKFMVKQKKKAKILSKPVKKHKKKIKEENIFEITIKDLEVFKCWLKIINLQNSFNKGLNLNYSFNVNTVNFSYLHSLKSKSFYLENLFSKIGVNFDVNKLKDFNWVDWKWKLDFFYFSENILKVFFKIFDFFILKKLFEDFQIQKNMIKNFFEFNLENSFKENFMTFLVEIFLNFLQIFFFYDQISKDDINLKIDTKSVAMKSFLIKVKNNLKKITSNNLIKIKIEDDDLIRLEELESFEIEDYFKIPSKKFLDTEISHKSFFLENLLNCRDILAFNKHFIISQNISQILLFQRLIKTIIKKLQKKNENFRNKSFTKRKKSYEPLYFSEKKMNLKNQIFEKKNDSDKNFFSVKKHDLFYDYNILNDKKNYNLLNKQFSCSICNVKIHGLALICGKCHHGGHEIHINQWFKNFNYCHQCIDCHCVFVKNK